MTEADELIARSDGRPAPRAGRPSINAVARRCARAWLEQRDAFPEWLTSERAARDLAGRFPRGRVVRAADDEE